MNATNNEMLQTQLSKAQCPGCQKVNLELRLRCDLGRQECLYLVKCRSCDTNYTVASSSEELAPDEPLIHDLFTKLTCARCGSSTAELGFQCDLRTHGCFYTFTCKSCGDVIKEYR